MRVLGVRAEGLGFRVNGFGLRIKKFNVDKGLSLVLGFCALNIGLRGLTCTVYGSRIGV